MLAVKLYVARYCFESTVSEKRTHWAWLSFTANSVSSAKKKKTQWVRFGTQIIGWEELTELSSLPGTLVHHNAATRNAALHNAIFSHRNSYPLFYSVIAVMPFPVFQHRPWSFLHRAHRLSAFDSIFPFATMLCCTKQQEIYQESQRSDVATGNAGWPSQTQMQRCDALSPELSEPKKTHWARCLKPYSGRFRTKKKQQKKKSFRWYVPCVAVYVPFCLQNRKGTPKGTSAWNAFSEMPCPNTLSGVQKLTRSNLKGF